jgi:hypothetical protein
MIGKAISKRVDYHALAGAIHLSHNFECTLKFNCGATVGTLAQERARPARQIDCKFEHTEPLPRSERLCIGGATRALLRPHRDTLLYQE